MGVFIAIIIILAWFANLIFSLTRVGIDFISPFFYFHLFLQAYLYTGLFITGHDAMHGTVSQNRFINRLIGVISVFLYAGMSYATLIRHHRMHHLKPGSEHDPDYSGKSQNFIVWWFRFMINYITWIQLLVMAVLFNILKIWFTDWTIIFFWVIPAVISTFQLFYFGTYLPHRLPHTQDMYPHRARTMKKNHIRAMLACYFFGYHREHHESPGTPWWKLYQSKS